MSDGGCSLASKELTKVGQRGNFETLIGIVVAFWRQRTWSQAELARELGVAVRTLKKYLDELRLAGWPFEREEDHPHVYWSVPAEWFPGGVLFDREDVAALLHLLVRIPESRQRARLLTTITAAAPTVITQELGRIVPPRSSDLEQQLLPAMLDAVAERKPLQLRYFTAHSGTLTDRVVSVQRVLVGPPVRFIAFCHRSRELRWFRLDYVSRVRAETEAAFHDVDDADVEALLNGSVGGFSAKTSQRVTFLVRLPEARWVAKNLPEGLRGTDVEDGFLVDCETHGLLPVARFVVGLGAAAECRSQALASAVRELAIAALEAVGPPDADLREVAPVGTTQA